MSNKTSDKNVANIEEDVKILEEFAEICKAGLACYDQTREGKALEHILAEREQKDKRIQELEKELENNIPKQAVIDKMEELNKEIKNSDEIDAIFKIKQQQVLQELLETK